MDAEDALQEPYVNIWKNAASYRSEVEGQPIQAMTWLIAIVRNKALDALRVRNRTRTTSFEDFLSTSPDTLEEHSDQAPSAMQLLERATQAVPATGTATSQLPDTSEKLLPHVSKLIVTVETRVNPTQPSDTLVYSGNCTKLW